MPLIMSGIAILLVEKNPINFWFFFELFHIPTQVKMASSKDIGTTKSATSKELIKTSTNSWFLNKLFQLLGIKRLNCNTILPFALAPLKLIRIMIIKGI